MLPRVLVVGIAAVGATLASAQHAGHGATAPDAMPAHPMPMAFGPIEETQNASGTAWQPSATPMHAHQFRRGDWQLMAHYNAFLAYDDQSGARGDEQFNSVNWFMAMASRRDGDSDLMLRTMLSLEPWSVTKRGYPLLFQSGEAYGGEPLVDRQHPHDFFMELAARYRTLLAEETVLSIYVAPSGEPALGPPAFPHRMSAMDNPAAPISHHWLDSTHIAFGVLTAGIARGRWQIEGSWFNGREPDESRWNIERPRLDSYAGRLTWNPTPAWSAQVSHGLLDRPELLHPDESVRRTTASLMHLATLAEDTRVATTIAWGRNAGHDRTNAFLLESSFMTGAHTVFARAEYVEKSGEGLNLAPAEQIHRVKQLTIGASRELVRDHRCQVALGASASYTFASDTLDALYGRNPVGLWIFMRVRPAAMNH